MTEITGYSPDGLVSFVPFTFIHPDDLGAVHERASRLGIDSDRVESSHRILRADGATRWVEARTSLVRKPDGSDAYVLVQLLDITERKRADEEVLRAREHAETITSAMAEGYCLFVDGHIAQVNRAMCEMTGFSEAELIGCSLPLPFWPPEEVDAIMRHRSEVLAAGGDTLTVPLLSKQGRRIDAEITLRLARSSDDSVLGYVTTVRDVSARTRYETVRAQRAAEELALQEILKLAASGAQQAVLLDRVVDELRQVFGAEAASVTRYHETTQIGELLSTSLSEPSENTGTFSLSDNCLEAHVYRSGQPAERVSTLPPHGAPDRTLVPDVRASVAAPIIVADRPWGCISMRLRDALVIEDASTRCEQFASIVALGIANAEAWDALARQAATDALTGLANRRAFEQRLISEMESVQQNNRSLSVVLIDIDHFKMINDTYGHEAGDRVLIEVAERMTSVLTVNEMVARLGGEEFVCLLPDTGPEEAVSAAERIRAAVSGRAFAEVGPVQVSAGVCANQLGYRSDDFLRCADRALYRAKESGRNTTVLYHDDAADCSRVTASSPHPAPFLLT